MALPPERLGELIQGSAIIVVARVTQVLALGPKPAAPAAARKLPKGSTSVGYEASWQRVKLEVERVLMGDAPRELTVEKPIAPYVLRAGDRGPFFIDAKGKILGRYGPDTHPLEAIERALAH